MFYLIQSYKLPWESGSIFPVSHEEMRYRPGIQILIISQTLTSQTFWPHPQVQAAAHSQSIPDNYSSLPLPALTFLQPVFPLRSDGS